MARALLIRRLPDADGQMVTYLPASEVTRLLGMSATTINRWMVTGAVRVTDALQGCRSVAVADAARLKRMTRREMTAEGLHLTPESTLAAQRAWYAGKQEKTIPNADQRGEEWASRDLDLLVTMILDHKTFEECADALGRTYAAVSDRVQHLKDAGDLPATVQDDEWWRRTRALLTLDEVVAVERMH